jgi:hypothetical protein
VLLSSFVSILSVSPSPHLLFLNASLTSTDVVRSASLFVDPKGVVLTRITLIQVKTRMQLQVGKPVAGAEHYNGMVDCFKKIIAKEG